jgi:hypothetical protein
LVKIGQKYWKLHEELQAFLYKAGEQIPQYLCPFCHVPEDSGFIYAQPASIATYRDCCCRHQGRDKKSTFIIGEFFS